MSMSAPPVAASWLLDRTRVPSEVCGDLIEEYHGGRSKLWFWWQAIVAVAVNVVHEVTANKALAVQAVLTGFGCSSLMSLVTMPVFLSILNRRADGFDAWHLFWFAFWPVAVPTVFDVLTGWLVARFYSQHKFGIVCAYLFSLWLVRLSLFIEMSIRVKGIFPDEFLFSEITLILSSIGILVVGLLVNRERNDIGVATLLGEPK